VNNKQINKESEKYQSLSPLNDVRRFISTRLSMMTEEVRAIIASMTFPDPTSR